MPEIGCNVCERVYDCDCDCVGGLSQIIFEFITFIGMNIYIYRNVSSKYVDI